MSRLKDFKFCGRRSNFVFYKDKGQPDLEIYVKLRIYSLGYNLQFSYAVMDTGTLIYL